MFRYLLSFHYYRDTDLDALAEAAGAPDLTFFADSGAFSAEHAGAQITTDEYAEWLKRWGHRIHAYASLDVLHDPAASQANLEALRSHGLDPLPVWHIGGPLEVLDRLLEERSYICIGGMVRASLTMRDPRLRRYLADVHERAARAGTALHGFGLGSWPMIERFPWYSADSSLASMGFRYGRVQVYDPYANTWRSWHLRDRKAWGRHGWLVREYGMSPREFTGSNVEARSALIGLAARSWSLAAKRLATRVYTTPHLSVSTIKADGGTETARSIMRQYEDGNEDGARIYAVVTNNRAQGQVEDLAAYVAADAGTALYLTDPHPSANKNYERIGPWHDGNRWAEEEAPT